LAVFHFIVDTHTDRQTVCT